MSILFGNILIIDDEANLRNSLSRILHKAGMLVTTASSGEEALQRIAAIDFDIVVLDLRLPDINGIELLQQLRNTSPRLPVIVLTGYGTMQTALDAMHLEATDYLLKPIQPDNLIERITMILKKRSIELRRKEIQEQIVALQTELDNLDSDPQLMPSSESRTGRISPSYKDRYFSIGYLTLDLQSKRARWENTYLNLPPSSFDYLVVLAFHSPDTVSHQTLVSEAQGYTVSIQEARALSKWHIHVIRQSIKKIMLEEQLIYNFRGIGYRLLVK